MPFRKARNWWFHLCTGRSVYERADEENYRQRILVMTSCFWLLTVILFAVVIPLFMDITPQGKIAANVLFVASILGVLISMLLLRLRGDRIAALNIMLLIYTGAFTTACFVFGGTGSPTYPLLVLAPAMAAIAGSVTLCASWGLLVIAIWICVLQAERQGFQFTQIILPENHSMAMMMAYTAMAISVVSVIIIYAEMNKALRTSLQASNSELEHLSSHDQLTRLPNRRFYDERIALALQRASEQDGLTGLLFMDLNEFKSINDTYGHGAGDKLLIAVAQRVQNCLRETDLVARLGGDEFVAVLEDVKSADEITRLAHKLSQAIEQPLYVRQQILKFSCSIGVAIFPIDGRQLHELEEKADKAMYLAKKRGIPVALASLESTNTPMPARAPTNRI
ncbi:MAG: diguanylate cyclase [Halioglobus sp.]|nr:diguanylate cyclase [Halioglobus sp.]